MREYDLLVGLLAFQLRLVSANAMAWYARTLKKDPNTRLADFLIENKAIAEADCALLLRVVDSIVHAHHGDAPAALETFGGAEATQAAFAGAIHPTASGWEPGEDDTVIATQLPHGLPRQIIPESLGRYTGGSEYARGGIGRILLVHDEQIGRDVILKELLPHRAASPTDSTLSRMPAGESPGSPMRQSAAMLARFLQEAKITGQLEHPSIVPVYELGLRKDGQLYYTMKLVRGNTLAVAIESCRTLDDRLALMRSFLDVCQAMAYAHSKGVIHRDLKPSNIMVGEFGECVVLDWGLAKTQKDPDVHREAMEKTLSQLNLATDHIEGLKTRSKDVLGTPLYMSPEQARGEIDTVGYHSDVYSLGVLLYEILSGSLPHEWTNSRDTVRRVGAVPAPPIEKAAPDTPPELAAICNKALAFEIRDRYTSAKDLATDVERYLSGALVEAYAYRVTDILKRLYRRHKTMIYTVGLAAATVLVVGVVSYVNIYRARNAEEAARIIAEEQREVARAQRAEAETQREAAETQRARAENAEERTAHEKYISDIRLADAYLRDNKYQAAEDTLLATDPRYRHIEWSYLASLCHQDLATLRGHTADIYAIQSPDGTRILTVSGDGSAKLWDAASNQVLHTWNLPDSLITSGAFSPDGTRVAIWMHDGSIHLFDTASGAAGLTWKAHPLRVDQCVFSSDGQFLLSSSEDRTVRLWRVDSGEAVWTSPALDGPAYQIIFTREDRAVLACPEGAAPVLLDRKTGVIRATARFTGMPLWSDETAVLVQDGNDVVVLSSADLKEAQRIPAGGDIGTVFYRPESRELLVGARNGAIALWDLDHKLIVQSFNLAQPLHTCLLNHAGTHVVAVSVEGHITVFDRNLAHAITEFGGHHKPITTVSVAPDDATLLTASVDGTAKRWSLSEPALLTLRTRTEPDSSFLGVSGDSRIIAFASLGGHLTVRDAKENALLLNARATLPTGSRPASISADNTRLAVALDGFLPAIISLADQRVRAVFRGHEGYITGVEFNAAGTELVTTSWDNTARVWNAETGALLGTLAGHTDTIYDAAFSPDGNHIATASRDENAIVWDRATLAPLFTIPHGSRVERCAFSPDGTLVATCGWSGMICVWDVVQRTERFRLTTQAQRISSIDFSADGRRLASHSIYGALTVWDLELGLPIVALPGLNEPDIGAARLSGPADSLLFFMRDGALREHRPLPLDAAKPIRTPEALRAALDAHRALAPTPVPASPAPRDTDLYLPTPKVAALIEHLRNLHDGNVAPDAPWTLKEAITEYFPVELQAGDTITALAGLAPAAFLDPANENAVQSVLGGSAPFTLDLLRETLLTRLRLHALPVITTEKTVTLEASQATALLQAALDTITYVATTMVQVKQDKTPPGMEANYPGWWIPTPLDTPRKALLRTAGLESVTRLVAINGEAVPDLEGLAALIQRAMTYLESNTSFSLRLRLERGAFEVVELTIESKTSM